MKSFVLSLALFLCSLAGQAQGRETVAIFGDSYSTYEGFLTPDTMETWYYQTPDLKRTDVSHVRQTWWWQVVSEGGYKLGKSDVVVFAICKGGTRHTGICGAGEARGCQCVCTTCCQSGNLDVE